MDSLEKIVNNAKNPRGIVIGLLLLGQAITVFVGLGKLNNKTGGDLQQQAAYHACLTLAAGVLCAFSYFCDMWILHFLGLGLWSSLFHDVIGDIAIFQSEVFGFRGAIAAMLAFTVVLTGFSLPLVWPFPKFAAFGEFTSDWVFLLLATGGCVLNWFNLIPSLEVAWWAALMFICRWGQYREGMIIALMSCVWGLPHYVPIPQNCYYLTYGQSVHCRGAGALGDVLLWLTLVGIIGFEAYRVHTGYPLFGGEAAVPTPQPSTGYRPPDPDDLDEPFTARSTDDRGYYARTAPNGDYTPRDNYTPRGGGSGYTPRGGGGGGAPGDYGHGQGLFRPQGAVGYDDPAPTQQLHGDVGHLADYNESMAFERDERL